MDYGGRSVVISGDTRPSDNLVKYAKGVDLLIHEVFMAATTAVTAQYHTLPEQAGDLFTRAAGCKGPLYVRTDLTSITVGDQVTVWPGPSVATPEIRALTNESYGAMLSSSGTIIEWGTGFSAEGGNSLRSARTSTVLLFWEKSASQLNAELGGRVRREFRCFRNHGAVTLTFSCGRRAGRGRIRRG